MMSLGYKQISGAIDYVDNEIIQNSIYQNMNQSSGMPISELINIKDNVFRFIVFPVDLTNDTVNEIESIVERNNQLGFEAHLTGVQTVMKDLNDVIIGSQVTTVVIALIGVFALLLISLRLFKLAIISTIPILITVVTLFAFLSIGGISLNIITATMFSITIGVGIDYAVHFSSVFKELRKEKGTTEALNETYKYCARPILTNALGLSIGFSIMIFSPLQIHLYLSLLMWVSMLMSVILSLSLLPSLIRVAYKDKS